MEKPPIVKIEVYLPPEALETISEALHLAGAGVMGHYDHCLSITEVTGRWRPLDQAKPYLGEISQVFSGKEYKLEVNCQTENVPAVLQALRKAHPYEEPVINIIPIINHLFG